MLLNLLMKDTELRIDIMRMKNKIMKGLFMGFIKNQMDFLLQEIKCYKL